MKWIVLVAVVLVAGVGGFLLMKNRNAAPGSAAQAQETAADAAKGNVKSTEQYFGNWGSRCDTVEGKPPYCEAFQRLSVKETRQRFMEFAVGFPAGAVSATGVVVLPLGVLVKAGGALKVDEKEPRRFSINTCLPAGCVARITLDETLLSEMKSGKLMAVTFANAEGKPMTVNLPLDGFDKALATIRP
ncbi:MAG: invasion associated locus B family protein [Alphaproteobacteria bacterium]|nr:invasion associated locus B family protein [Alphaproteobacteria bacterium]